jgi:hypothetical protein
VADRLRRARNLEIDALGEAAEQEQERQPL